MTGFLERSYKVENLQKVEKYNILDKLTNW